MGVKDAYKGYKALLDVQTPLVLVPPPREGKRAVIFDVSGLIHKYHAGHRASMSSSASRLSDTDLSDSDAATIVAKIIGFILSHSTSEHDIYVVFDGRAADSKRRTAEFVEQEDDDWETLEGLSKIVKRYSTVANDIEFTKRILEAHREYAWEHVDANILLLCRSSSDDGTATLMQEYILQWGHEELITKTLMKAKRPPSNIYRLLKAELEASYGNLIVVQACGEDDADIARIASQYDYDCDICSPDSDMYMTTLATMCTWSTSKYTRNVEAFRMWTTAIMALLSCPTANQTLAAVTEHVETMIGEKPDTFTAAIIAIASNFLCQSSDYHAGVKGVGAKAIERNLCAGTCATSSLGKTITGAILENWYENWVRMAAYLETCAEGFAVNDASFAIFADNAITTAMRQVTVPILRNKGMLQRNVVRFLHHQQCPHQDTALIQEFYATKAAEYVEFVKSEYIVSGLALAK